jgi:hypothetical protein
VKEPQSSFTHSTRTARGSISDDGGCCAVERPRRRSPSALCLQIAPPNPNAQFGSNYAFCFDERTCAEVSTMTTGKRISCLLSRLPPPDSSASPVRDCVVVSLQGPGLMDGQRTMGHTGTAGVCGRGKAVLQRAQPIYTSSSHQPCAGSTEQKPRQHPEAQTYIHTV